ncbi:MAG: hypothetical protein RR212_07725 [Bacteroidales bacterium]
MKKQITLLLLLIMVCAVPYASAQRIGRWEKLGEKSVSLHTERDVIRSAHKGFFSHIKIHVKGNPVDFKKVYVKFLDGSTQEIHLRKIIPAGGESREINLRGNKRIIKEIVFYYKAKPRKKGDRNNRHRPSYTPRASVSVWGRH